MISVSVAKTRSSRRAAGLWLEAQVDNYICVFVYVLVLLEVDVCVYFFFVLRYSISLLYFPKNNQQMCRSNGKKFILF